MSITHVGGSHFVVGGVAHLHGPVVGVRSTGSADTWTVDAGSFDADAEGASSTAVCSLPPTGSGAARVVVCEGSDLHGVGVFVSEGGALQPSMMLATSPSKVLAAAASPDGALV